MSLNRLSKPCYIHTMEHSSAIKRDELLTDTKIWKDLQGIMLNEKKPIWKGQTL